MKSMDPPKPVLLPISIEKKLANRHLKEGSFVFYDLTSLWYEGKHCPLAERGYSRDGKRGKLQIELGLLCDIDGRPIAVEVFEGSRSDPTTVSHQIEKLRHRFKLDRVVIVGDWGMLTEARINNECRPHEGLRLGQCIKGTCDTETDESGSHSTFSV